MENIFQMHLFQGNLSDRSGASPPRAREEKQQACPCSAPRQHSQMFPFFLSKQYRACLGTILVWPAFARASICQLVEPKAEGNGCLLWLEGPCAFPCSEASPPGVNRGWSALAQSSFNPEPTLNHYADWSANSVSWLLSPGRTLGNCNLEGKLSCSGLNTTQTLDNVRTRTLTFSGIAHQLKALIQWTQNLDKYFKTFGREGLCLAQLESWRHLVHLGAAGSLCSLRVRKGGGKKGEGEHTQPSPESHITGRVQALKIPV